MKSCRLRKLVIALTLLLSEIALFPDLAFAQSYAAWYANAQQRIDTLRKGNFGIMIFDKEGQSYTGEVAVRMEKHEFPFGIAFDFYEGTASMGNTYRTSEAISAAADSEIYQTERWDKYLAYAIPVQTGKGYIVTLKLAEIYHSSANSRIFDAHVDGTLFLDDYDIFSEAGGKNIARDTSLQILADKNFISIEFTALVDNAAVKGIVIDEVGGGNVIRINCGGPAITTQSGNQYVTEVGYFDPDISTVATKEQWMKAAMYKYYNYGTSGNSFKWSGIQPLHTEPNYSNFDNAVRWTQKAGWELRAHTLLWGGNDDHSMPRWVRELPTPEAITDTCKMRVIREVSRYRGIIKEYDVINEPLTGHADSLRNNVGDSILWNCFKWARSADPDARLYINDYNVEYNWGQAEEYRDLILRIREMGGPVTGVGVQAHFWDCCRPNVDELVKNLNIIAEAGLPIRLTEYDYGGNLTQAQQAADFIKVLTVAFSHPSINGMICWGLSDDGAWRENTGFFDALHKPKLAADTLLYFTRSKWATNFDTLLHGLDTLSFNAYYGEYAIEVSFGDTVKVFTIPCLKEYADTVFSLYETDARLKGPRLVSAELDGDETVKLTFDKPVWNNSVKRSDFKFFSNDGIAVEEILTDQDHPEVLSMILSNSVREGDYISVSYFPGYLTGTDGSKAKAFGPEGMVLSVKDTVTDPVYVPSAGSDLSIKVFPNPASDNLTIQSGSAPFQISLFNIQGAELFAGRSESSTFNLDVSRYPNGIYILKITVPENGMTIRKIMLR
jgi:GH35 family endo-1,4-beta-xylanase